jgi:hypothetical protein
VISSEAGGGFDLLMVNRGPFRTSGPMLEVFRVVTRVFNHDLSTGAVARVSDAIPGVESRHIHELNVAAGRPLAFSTSRWESGLQWELRDPAGARVFGPELSGEVGAYFLATPQSGRYHLTFTATHERWGRYQFSAGTPQTVTTSHDLVSGTNLLQDLVLPLTGSARVLELQLEAAQSVRLRLSVQDEGCAGTTQVRLNQPDGAVLFSARLADCVMTQDILTSAAGLYRLTVSIPSDARPEFVRVEIMRGTTAAADD